MWCAQDWVDYALLDMGGGMKLERWGDVLLARPEPQAIWPRQRPDEWEHADAVYHRAQTGGGSWEYSRSLPQGWQIGYGALRLIVRPTGFKHTGLFPEQAVNWQWMQQCITAARRPVSVLNLFAYTGGATMACAQAGAEVCHVDAAKGMVQWAHDNAAQSMLGQAPIRYIVDDCLQFVRREIRRGRRYDAIVMDPPSFGHGPQGGTFKFERDVYTLITECVGLLSDQPLFFLLNSYTAGFAPAVAQNALQVALPGGAVQANNIGIQAQNGLCLPCGASARWQP